MTVTSASACRRALVPNSPPKPDPITTTRCRGAGLVVFTSAITSIVPNNVLCRPVGGRSFGHTRSHARWCAGLRHDGSVTHYDLAVIGTGSGNTVVTKQLKDWKVAILEHGVFGGTCSNVGCIPTKMFVYPADLVRGTMHAQKLGVNTRI